MDLLGLIFWILIIFVALYLLGLVTAGSLGLGSMMAMFGGGSKKLTLFSRDPWIDSIISGKKTVDGRLGTLEKFPDIAGQQIHIVGSGKKAKAKVVAARHYATLDAYVKGEGWKKISPHAKSEADAIKELAALTKKDGGLIYAPEAIKAAGGIVAIEFTDIVPREKK